MKKLKKRAAIGCLAVLSSALASSAVWAAYPEEGRRIDIMVPFAAGGFTDNVGRLVAQGLSEKLHVPVVVVNKPGAAGILAISATAQAPNDGYTLFLANTASDTINPNIHTKMTVDPGKAFRPVILILKTPNLVAVNNDLKANSIKELIGLAKKDPAQLTFGTPGVGTTGHLTGELFDKAAAIDMRHIPYKGTQQSLTDLVAGRIQVTFDNITTLAPLVKDKRIRGLAVTSDKRSSLLPDVPTVAEAGLAGFEATSWVGIEVRSGTPDAVVDTLNKAIASVISTDEFKSKMNGAQIVGGTPAEFGDVIQTDRKKWGGLVRDLKLVAD